MTQSNPASEGYHLLLVPHQLEGHLVSTAFAWARRPHAAVAVRPDRHHRIPFSSSSAITASRFCVSRIDQPALD